MTRNSTTNQMNRASVNPAAPARLTLWVVASASCCLVLLPSLTRADELPWIDLDGDAARQVTVDRQPGQYLGHPTTLLLEDNKTILCVYPQGHGKGPIVYKRSTDGGKTWSERLPTPATWATSKETPTLHRVISSSGKKRILLFSGLHPIRQSISEDDGLTWSELQPIGNFGGIVAMGTVFPVLSQPGTYRAMFHDDGRFYQETTSPEKGIFTLYQTTSHDAGSTWSTPQAITSSSELHLCEPGSIRSPDGSQIAVLLRENRRLANSHIIFSNDEGATWSAPAPLPDALTGDRHTAAALPDGRLFISFRDVPKQGSQSPTRGDWVAWVGSYADLVHGTPGAYRIRLKKNHKGFDCAYPGVEVQPDGTLITTTYGHWIPGEPPFVISIRLRLDETDAKLADAKTR